MVTRKFYVLRYGQSEKADVTGVYKIKTNRVRKDGTSIFMHQITAVSAPHEEDGDVSNLSKIVSAADAAAIWKSMGKKGAIPVKAAKASAKKKSCEQIAKAVEERCEERRAVKKEAAKAVRAAAKKAPVAKKPAAKKAPAKKPAAKKAPAKKAPVAKKAPAAKKPAAKKAPTKRKVASKK